jgi:single-strand DNA-binding protein
LSAPITLSGRLGADPELRFSPSGVAVVKLSIVTSRRVRNDQTQEWTDADVTWWDCTGFKQLAENVASSLGKGMAVIATGRAVQENWQDKEGNKRSKIAVKLDSIAPDLSWATAKVEKAQRGQGGGQQGGQQRQAPQANDAWSSQGRGGNTGGGWGSAPSGGGFSEEPPF